MNNSSQDPKGAEAIRLKRLRSEELEKVAEMRTAMLKYGATAGERDAKNKRSKRTGKYVLWFLVTLCVLTLIVRYYEYFVEPLIDAEFAPEAMRLFAWANASVLGMIGLLFFYHKNPVHHLSKRRRVVANVLRYGGGLALPVACILFWADFYVVSVIAALGAGLILWCARCYAKRNVSL